MEEISRRIYFLVDVRKRVNLFFVEWIWNWWNRVVIV
jgi:hypothetical protein